MFEILKHLRDINMKRVIHWQIEDGDGEAFSVLVVRIPISDEDAEFMRDMQRLFAPAEED